jgi:hypothetical protein
MHWWAIPVKSLLLYGGELVRVEGLIKGGYA